MAMRDDLYDPANQPGWEIISMAQAPKFVQAAIAKKRCEKVCKHLFSRRFDHGGGIVSPWKVRTDVDGHQCVVSVTFNYVAPWRDPIDADIFVPFDLTVPQIRDLFEVHRRFEACL